MLNNMETIKLLALIADFLEQNRIEIELYDKNTYRVYDLDIEYVPLSITTNVAHRPSRLIAETKDFVIAHEIAFAILAIKSSINPTQFKPLTKEVDKLITSHIRLVDSFNTSNIKNKKDNK